MALQVWLPLNGTFENKGIQDITVTASGSATFATGGKISEQALQGNGSTYWNINPITLGSEASICCWSKTATNAKMMWVLEATSYPYLNLYASSVYSLNVGNGSTNAFKDNNNNTITVFNDNKWHHFVVTFGNNQSKLYIDGDYKGMAPTFKNPTTTASKRIKIGGGFSNGHSYDWNGMINDFRVYDHCLSPLEVKEIAQGLILHYKMDNSEIESTTNLCKQLVAGGQTTVTNNIITHNGTNSDTYWYIKPLEALVGGATYTVSCYLSGFANDTDWIRWGVGAQSGDNSAGNWTTYNGYNSFTFTMPAGRDGSAANFIFDDSNGGTGRSQVFTISNVQLEKKDHATAFTNYGTTRADVLVQDSSGYNYNGQVIGTVETFTTNSGRYNNCFYINSSDLSNNTTDEYYISTDCGLITPSELSVSWWSYPEASYRSTTTITNGMWCTTANDIASDYLVSAFNHRDSTFDVNASDGTHISLPTSSTVVTGSEWHHYVVTYDGQIAKFYKDGVQKSSVAFTEPKTLGNFTKILIGHSEAGSVHRKVRGKYSDFRVYVTALDENAIKNLYNVSMKMDNLNNIHTFEIEELNQYSRELIADEPLYTPYSSTTTPWTGYNENGEIYMTGTCSLGTRKTIQINPNGNSFYYDFTISANVGNYIFLQFSRYDADYTQRSNDATISVYAGKLTTPISHKRIQGIVDLSTDGINPCKYIRFRALCGYSGYEGDNPYLIIHSMSLREVKTTQTQRILKNGIFQTDTITEDIGNIQFKKLGMTYANEFIER